jgi:putative thiamine transport system permease protein
MADKVKNYQIFPTVALRTIPLITLILFIGPVAAGLIGTILPAFGYLPALGGNRFSLDPVREMLLAPGIYNSIRLSFFTGLATTIISLALVILFCASWHGTRLFTKIQRVLSPFLSVPHVTIAFGLSFLLTPSGWFFRLTSPWATGIVRPPDIIITQDPLGMTLVAALVIKEVPFLFLMTLAAINQINYAQNLTVARSLGYGAIAAWLKTVFPKVYQQIRLPIFAVLAYAISVVDVAIVIAPTTPPPLAVQLLRWFNDPEILMRFIASAGAILQFILVILALGVWWICEKIITNLGRKWIFIGWRFTGDKWLRLIAAICLILVFVVAFFSLVSMAIWSISGDWRFPSAFPQTLSMQTWINNANELYLAAWNTLVIGFITCIVSLILTIGCLENEIRIGKKAQNKSLLLLYTPMLIPQVAFLFGTQIMLILLRIDGSWLAIIWTHLIFVLPYVFISLADPYRSWDKRYADTASCLGARPLRLIICVKLPMLLRPILISAAVGFAVSVGLYLPTVFAGAGKFDTLTTEAVSLAASGNRRTIGTYALLQMLLPFFAFALATAIPSWLHRNRRGLMITK